jgi:hypothetical protein
MLLLYVGVRGDTAAPLVSNLDLSRDAHIVIDPIVYSSTV